MKKERKNVFVLLVILLLTVLVFFWFSKKKPEPVTPDNNPFLVDTACIKNIQAVALQYEAIASKEAKEPEVALEKWQKVKNLTDNPNRLIDVKINSCMIKTGRPDLGDPQSDCSEALEMARQQPDAINADKRILAILTYASVIYETDSSTAWDLLNEADEICNKTCNLNDDIQNYRNQWQPDQQ